MRGLMTSLLFFTNEHMCVLFEINLMLMNVNVNSQHKEE